MLDSIDYTKDSKKTFHMRTKNNAMLLEELPKGETRTEQLTQRLLEAATQLFMEKGYDATSMGEISARAHASKETFYRHFPTKDELFRAVVIRQAEMIARDLGSMLLVHDPPEKALTTFGEFMLTRMMTKDTIAFHRLLGMAKERFPELLQLYRTTGPRRVRDAMAKYLADQMAQGKLRKMDPDVAARQFFDLAAAEMIMNASISGVVNPSKAVIEQRVKEAVDCFLHGYAT
jgi:TetR/AcrR family transcriptional repressor of mexJK operon